MPSFDHCLSLHQLQDKIPVDEIRDVAKDYQAQGLDAAEAMEKATQEHLDQAQRDRQKILATAHLAYAGDAGKPATAPAQPRVSDAINLGVGAIVRDEKGQEYRVHAQRRGLVTAHPIVDGKEQVSRDTTVRFWTEPDLPPASENDRLDPIYLVKQPERTAGDAAKSAALNTAGGFTKAIEGLGALFGADINKKMGVVPFDETKYQAAAEHFQDAIAHFEGAATDVADVMRAVIKAVLDRFGSTVAKNMKPYVVRFTQDYKDGKIKLKGETNVDERTAAHSERDPGQRPDDQPTAEQDIFDVRPAADRGQAPGTDGQPDAAGAGSADRAGVPGRDAAAGGAPRDRAAPGGNRPGRPAGGAAEPGDAGRGGDRGHEESKPQSRAIGEPATALGARLSLDEKRLEQLAAEGVPVIPGDRANIDATLPFLMPGQRDDVHFAETRLNNPEKEPGVMFTNGTGTGKTFTGLGIIKRLERQGKGNGIIIVPNNGIAKDWIDSGKNLGLNIRALDSTTDHGDKGIVVTTYANFGDNRHLADRRWDFVMPDEAHYLMANKDAKDTKALDTFRALTRHPDGWAQYSRMVNRDLYAKLEALGPQKSKSKGNEESRAEYDKILDQIIQREAALHPEYNEVANSTADRPKAIFLSATPFAYDKAIDYANGYLFKYPEASRIGNSNQGGRERFMVDHFGYRIRYHKLTEPDGNVDRGLMARQFNEYLKKTGALSGRVLDVEADYDRKFLLAESALGSKIDEGLEFVREHPEYKHLYQPLMKQFDYLSRRYLLEAIKAREALPEIQAHMNMGRKVVVVHDYKKGGAFNPFHMRGINGETGYWEDGKYHTVDLAALADKFKDERRDLVNLAFPKQSALDILKGAFPSALVHNGDVSEKQLQTNKRLFNADNFDNPLMILQSDKGREGISLHDTTGKHQRVMINIGMPSKPTALIQLEGRIYRTGQASDAIFRYLNTGTNWERHTFADTIAGRADIAEALAMGEQARGLKDAIIEAFEDSAQHEPGADDGRGGKARDRQNMRALTDWDRAKSFYYSQLKRNSSTKAAEGKDYYATPEPVGQKMVEWADMRPGESVLEPSAGHGAISRWFPTMSNKTIIEPSSELMGKARLTVQGDASSVKALQSRFEDLHLVNKFDTIVMNPPFNKPGSTGSGLAFEHLAKAYKHLNEGGRIVAILPKGPAADKKFDKFLYGDEAPKDLHLVADIDMPSSTFERAGTGVMTHIVVLDKLADAGRAPNLVERSYVNAESPADLFDRIQHATIPGRAKTETGADVAIEEAKPVKGRKPAREAAPDATGGARHFEQFQFDHTKTGDPLFGAAMLNRTSGDAYYQALAIAKEHGGWYNKFVGGDAKRGFLFKSADDRAAFMEKAGQLDEVKAGRDGVELNDITDRGPDRRAAVRSADDRRTIEVDGERRPIRDSLGRTIAGGDFMKQMEFWRNYDGPTDDAGRPILDESDGRATYDIPRDQAASNPLAQAARKRFDQAMAEAEHWLQSNGKTASLRDLPPSMAMESLDMMMGHGVGKFSEAAKAQGRAIWDRVNGAYKQLYRHNGDLESAHDIPELMRGPMPAPAEKATRVATLAKLKQAGRALDAGKIDQEQYKARIDDLVGQLEDRNAARGGAKDFERGADWVTERLLRARRTGELKPETVNFALWALGENPHLAHDLAISLRSADHGMAGSYRSAERIMRLFKGNENDGTAVHEILHHAERMMPEDVQAGIVDAWRKAFADAYHKADPKTRAALEDMLAMSHDKDAAQRTLEAFRDGTLKYDEHYQLSNPSEYWAVNATRLMQDRYSADTWAGKAKQWLRELGEKVKGWLGLKSDSAVLKGLKAVLDGDGTHVSPQMLVERAAGGNGRIDPVLHDITNPAPTPEEAERATARKSLLASMISVPKDALKSAVFETKMMVMPISAGSVHAMAWAKDFANRMRKASNQWRMLDDVLSKRYTEDQLEKMWIAADQENDLRREGRTSTTEGLASLTEDERRTVELLHAYGEELWNKAKAAGMVAEDAEGVNYWTPRMAARVFEDGSVERLQGRNGQFSKEATNLKTTSPNLKQRKYDYTAQSEGALRTKHGDDAAYIKNIRVMPLAMAHLEKAIAGRTLVNQVKAHGAAAGVDLISNSKEKGYDTIDHPALTRWVPRRDDQGHMVMGEDGRPIFDRLPLYIKSEFLGPLRAVFTKDDPKAYRAIMALKGLETSLIMISPATHFQVIMGKALPTMITTMGWKNNLKNAAMGGINVMVKGNQVRQNHALMAELIEGGLVPVSGRGMNPDLEAIANGLQPGRSLAARALGSAVDLASKKAGNLARRGVDKAGYVWHEMLLWNRIADIQAGMAVQMRQSLMDQGVDQKIATLFATHYANRYAGMIPREALSRGANMLANLALFSKSFTGTNIGAYKDVIGGLPREVQAQILLRAKELVASEDKSQADIDKAAGKMLSQMQRKARIKGGSIMVMDLAALAGVTSIMQALLQSQSMQDFKDDFKDRLGRLGVRIQEHPTDLIPFIGHPLDLISSLSQTDDNPHGKQDRVRVGEDDAGNSYYMRFPFGKIGEELKQYGDFTTGMHMLHNKASTFLRPFIDLGTNEDITGKRIIKPGQPFLQQAASFAGYWAKSQLPLDDLVATKNALTGNKNTGGDAHILGHDFNMDQMKAIGWWTGLSVSKVAGGDVVAEMRYQNREQGDDLRDVLPDVREAIQHDDPGRAQQILEQAGQTPKEAQRIMRGIENPGGINKSQMKRFNAHATDDEKEKLERMRNRN